MNKPEPPYGARRGESFKQAADRWQERRAAIVAHFAASQSYTETGKAFGISRQRVHQIVVWTAERAA